MGLIKSEIFTEEQNRLAALAKGLGHPARIAIVQHLLKVQTCICGDLVEEIGLAQPTISQHLKGLKQIGLLKGRVEGTSVCYCIIIWIPSPPLPFREHPKWCSSPESSRPGGIIWEVLSLSSFLHSSPAKAGSRADCFETRGFRAESRGPALPE